MKLYQIVETSAKNNDAGTKATQDITCIAKKNGFETVGIKMRTTKLSLAAKLQRQVGYWNDWKNAYQTIETESVVLLQNPFHYPQVTREKILRKLKKDKKIKYISVVHDVEELRKFRYNDYYSHEFEVMMELSDVLIVHNTKMAEFFIEKGLPEEKIVILEIFDYLQSSECETSPEFARQITVAGNLDTKKCAYIGQLQQLKGIDIQLYGPNFDEKMKNYGNIHYGGSLLPDEVPQKLTKGFGLVWDGTSIDGCQGDAGQYLRYNNPHKLSLYLSSGLPVVIWSGAAEADFVKRHNVGIAVESLLELPDQMTQITAESYNIMKENVAKLSYKLKNGYYADRALKEALCKINNDKIR